MALLRVLKRLPNSKEVPQIFIVMTYLYTVHPSLTISNVHIYLPADANDLDASMLILTIPEIELRGERQEAAVMQITA